MCVHTYIHVSLPVINNFLRNYTRKLKKNSYLYRNVTGYSFSWYSITLLKVARRYSDYPDSYYCWNFISLGSIISINRLLFLIFVIFESLLSKRFVLFKFYQSSLEWLNNYPSFDHIFNEIPLLIFNKIKIYIYT